ncbi:MAG: histidine triad nucleotide-binding protein [Treponema sp.]|jgi:histidine triad (HIT) family protein|nr:histidine triad nucleotide-binding protein [Treponema sp.]
MSDCIFCKIIAGQLPSKKIYEDDEILAFLDINPVTPVHFLVIPKKHIKSLMDLSAEDSALVGRLMFKAQELAKQQGCEEKGGRFIINAKSDGGQTVDHLHIHFLGGIALGASLLQTCLHTGKRE